MKKIAKKSIALMLMLIMLMGAMSTVSFAATKTKTVKKSKFLTSTSAIKKKATTIKKGTTKFTVKSGSGYMKFTAPKTKTYSFTFSNLKDKKYGSCAFVEIQVPDKTYPSSSFLKKVKTKGGKDSVLWLSVNGKKFSNIKKTIDRPIAKRTGKLKLKKGESVYFYFYNGTSKTTGKLKIK